MFAVTRLRAGDGDDAALAAAATDAAGGARRPPRFPGRRAGPLRRRSVALGAGHPVGRRRHLPPRAVGRRGEDRRRAGVGARPGRARRLPACGRRHTAAVRGVGRATCGAPPGITDPPPAEARPGAHGGTHMSTPSQNPAGDAPAPRFDDPTRDIRLPSLPDRPRRSSGPSGRRTCDRPSRIRRRHRDAPRSATASRRGAAPEATAVVRRRIAPPAPLRAAERAHRRAVLTAAGAAADVAFDAARQPGAARPGDRSRPLAAVRRPAVGPPAGAPPRPPSIPRRDGWSRRRRRATLAVGGLTCCRSW